MGKHTTWMAAGAAAAVVALVAAPARSDNVTVAIDNPGGSRTMYVEDLLGSPLTELDFGLTRAQPFRVRVVDSSMDRDGFTISASMSNLYLDTGSGLDFTDSIASSNVSISHPANPLNILDVDAVVAPVFDAVTTLANPALCAIVGWPTVGGTCTNTLTDLDGTLQTVPLNVDLNDLTALPLVPQGSEVGTFDNPSYEGLAATAPQPPSPPAPTSKQMMKGLISTSPATLAAIEAALAGVLAGQSLTDMVGTGTITAALRDNLGVVYDTLSAAQVQTILDATVATAQNLVAANVLGQAGTYLSLPLLSVAVPAGATAGTFRGTLVVTGLQP